MSEKPKKQFPGKAQMLANFSKAAVEIVKSGFEVVSEEQLSKRLDTCNDCELLIRDEKRCGSCGCYLSAKAPFKASKCPEGKWKG